MSGRKYRESEYFLNICGMILRIKLYTNFFSLLILLLMGNALQAQTSSWDDEAKTFVAKASKNRYKYSIQEVEEAVEKSTTYINTVCRSCSREILSTVYIARANLRIYELEYKLDSADGGYRPSPQIVSAIKSDFLKAQTNCQKCQCDLYDNIMAFYSEYGTLRQLDSLSKEAKVIGKPSDHSFIGIDPNYISQKSIGGIGFGIVNAWTVRQPKKWLDALSRRYRKCNYEYPMAVGFFFVGYERSFVNSKYNAVKIDPVWLNYIFSVHPAQVLYADGPHGKTFIYRPELGVSFSTFAVNYALNIPLNASFGFLSQHNLSIRFTIPAIKLN